MSKAIVTVYGREPWIPVYPSSPARQEEQQTKLLLDSLPLMVALAISNDHQSADEMVMTDEVMIRVESLHPWSSGVPDIWIDVQHDVSSSDQDLLNSKIISLLHGQFGQFFARTWDRAAAKPALYGLECRPLTGTGMVVQADGINREMERWGYVYPPPLEV